MTWIDNVMFKCPTPPVTPPDSFVWCSKATEFLNAVFDADDGEWVAIAEPFSLYGPRRLNRSPSFTMKDLR